MMHHAAAAPHVAGSGDGEVLMENTRRRTNIALYVSSRTLLLVKANKKLLSQDFDYLLERNQLINSLGPWIDCNSTEGLKLLGPPEIFPSTLLSSLSLITMHIVLIEP